MMSVVIPTHNTSALTVKAVESVLTQALPGTEIIVVDDGSSDGTSEHLSRRFPTVKIIQNLTPLGFSASANRGLAQTRAEILFLLNSDTIATTESLAKMTQAFDADPDLGIAGATLRFPDGTPQWSGGAFPSLPWLFVLTSGMAVLAATLPFYRRFKKPGTEASTPVQWVTGAAMAIRRQCWDEVGPMDEGYRFYGQDMDLCRKASDSGWRIALIPNCIINHLHGATISKSGGTTDSANPEYLWSDILRFIDRNDGPRAARRARRVMRIGAWVRLAGMATLQPLRSHSSRDSARNRRACYRRASAGLLQPENKPPTRE